MPDIIGVGSSFVDYFFETDKNFLKKHALKPEDDFLFEEKNISPQDLFHQLPLLAKSPGGICPNTLAVLSRLRVNVSYHGVIGADQNGRYWLKNIGRIDTTRVIKTGETSICACLLTNGGKQRTFLSALNPLDNDFFSTVDYKYLNTAKFIHIGPCLQDIEHNILKLQHLIKKLQSPLVSFAPNLIYAKLGLTKLLPIIKRTYVLFLNEKEIKLLVNMDIKKGSKYLLKFGPKIIVCTLGQKGVLITSEKEQFLTPGVKVKKIVDSTGAGDSFAAGFLYGLMKKKSLIWSAKFANKLASKSLADFGLNWLKRLNLHL